MVINNNNFTGVYISPLRGEAVHLNNAILALSKNAKDK